MPLNKETKPNQSLRGGAYPSAEIHSVYSALPADWTIGHSLVGRGGLSPLQKLLSVYSAAPQPIGTLIKETNFTKGVGNRKFFLQLQLFQRNQ